MPNCKNCNREISNFDNDICPYCGCEHPIEDDYQTMDITRNITKKNPSYQLYKAKKKKTFALLAFFLGFLGIENFYIGFKKKGLIKLLCSIGIYGVLTAVLYFFIFKNYLSFALSGAFLILIFNVIPGIVFLCKDSPKDCNGEFLR